LQKRFEQIFIEQSSNVGNRRTSYEILTINFYEVSRGLMYSISHIFGNYPSWLY
jgi:hypothetical protein